MAQHAADNRCACITSLQIANSDMSRIDRPHGKPL